MQKRNKKAISTLVATVLLILITVAAVAIIWGAVMPMITRITQSGQACINARYTIDTSSGYTCKNSTTILVAIERGAEDFDTAGAQFVFLVGGNTITKIRTTNLPGKNEMRTFSFTDADILQATRVSVAPIVRVGNTQTICGISPNVDIPTCA